MFRNISLSFLLLAFTSCTTKQVNLRIRNTSPYTYDSVVVNTSGGENIYGTITPGTASYYKVFDYAYSYAHISLFIDTANYFLLPIDYVGEQKLQSGKYTYVVSVYDTATRQLGLTLVED